MTRKNYRELKAETKQQRIFFSSQKFSSRFPNLVPELHREKFSTIQELGRMLYDTYAFVPGCESLERPWQKENKRKASRLVRDAIRCREANKNESGWRYELEPKVFERFEIEVTWLVSDGLSAGPQFITDASIVRPAAKGYGDLKSKSITILRKIQPRP